jgi:hypothetical protein
MAASQSRIADTIDKFYGSADRTSEGAMAANAYKRSIDELDSSISRELVREIIFTSNVVSLIIRTRHTELASWSHWER